MKPNTADHSTEKKIDQKAVEHLKLLKEEILPTYNYVSREIAFKMEGNKVFKHQNL